MHPLTICNFTAQTKALKYTDLSGGNLVWLWCPVGEHHLFVPQADTNESLILYNTNALGTALASLPFPPDGSFITIFPAGGSLTTSAEIQFPAPVPESTDIGDFRYGIGLSIAIGLPLLAVLVFKRLVATTGD